MDPLATDKKIEFMDRTEEPALDKIKEEPIDVTWAKKFTDSKPVVYTTRLDDMGIFKQDFTHLHPEDVIDSIIYESKPKIKKLCDSKIQPRINLLSYNDVVHKLNIINYKAQVTSGNSDSESEDTLVLIKEEFDDDIVIVEEPLFNNAEILKRKLEDLLKMCKPVSVVLTDIKTLLPSGVGNQIIQLPNHSQLKSLIVNKKVNKVVKNISHKYDLATGDVFISDGKLMSFRNVFFVIKNNHSNDVEVYFIDSCGYVTVYYKLDGIVDDKSLNPFIGNTEAIKLDSCCWYQREEMIKSMWPKFLPTTTSKFLRKPHRCNPGKCNCCCRDGKKNPDSIVPICPVTRDNEISLSTVIPTFDLTEDDEMQNLEKEISNTVFHINKNVNTVLDDNSDWIQDLLMKSPNSSTIIDRALRYTRQVIQKHNYFEMTSFSSTSNAVQVIHLDILKENVVESYQIDTDGNVASYANTHLSKSGHNANWFTKHLNIMDAINSIISKKVCCWFQREKVIKELSTQIPKAANFMKRPHTCPTEKCSCCCRRTKKTIYPPPLLNLTLPQRIRHTRDFSTIKRKTKVTVPSGFTSSLSNTTGLQGLVNIGTAVKPVHNQANMENSTVKQRKKDKPTIPVRKIIENTQKIKNQKQNVENTDRFTANPNKNATVTVRPKTLNTNNTQNVQPLNILPRPENTSASAHVMGVDSLITTILDRFQDVRLTINEDGKVAAALSTPVNTLSTSELKVLANILSHAQEQVKALGLGPGTNLHNHINVINPDLSETIVNSVPDQPVDVPPLVKFNTQATKPTILNFSMNTPNQRDFEFVGSSMVNNNTNRDQEKMSTSKTNVTISTKTQQLQRKSDLNICKSYSNLISEKNVSYNDSLHSMSQTFAPIIQNVFSLQHSEEINTVCNNNKIVTNSESVKVSTGNRQQCIDYKIGNKRTSVDNQSPAQNKIRVISPAKLGVSASSSCRLLKDSTELEIPTFNIPKPSESQSEVKSALPQISVSGGNIELRPLMQPLTPAVKPPIPMDRRLTQINVSDIQTLSQLTQNSPRHIQSFPPNTNNNNQLLSQSTPMKAGNVQFLPQTIQVNHDGKISQFNVMAQPVPYVLPIETTTIPITVDGTGNIQLLADVPISADDVPSVNEAVEQTVLLQTSNIANPAVSAAPVIVTPEDASNDNLLENTSCNETKDMLPEITNSNELIIELDEDDEDVGEVDGGVDEDVDKDVGEDFDEDVGEDVDEDVGEDVNENTEGTKNDDDECILGW